MSWKSPLCEPTVPQQWLWCQPSLLCPAEVQGWQGTRQGTKGGPGTCFVDSSEEQKGHAKEVAAESRAGTMWRRDEVTEQERRQPGTEGQQLGMPAPSCSEALHVRGVPGLLQQLLPSPDPWMAPLPGCWEEKQAPPESYCPWTSTWEVHA